MAAEIDPFMDEPKNKRRHQEGGRMKDSGGAEWTRDCITFVLPDSHDIVKEKKREKNH